MFRRILVACIVVSFSSISAFAHDEDPGPRPVVQIALLLDTSNSMDGLIRQAQTQLWKIVNETARCKRDGRAPRVMVALYEYGNSRLPITDGYIRQVLPLTDDLDRVSEKLFALTTCGGDEYCGEVIQRATRELDWTSTPGTFRAIFIAGNEPFTQGSVDYRKSCRRAIDKGIVVNTIHCGSESEGVAGMWRDGAKIGEGRAMNIDQDRSVARIDCPQDEQIRKFSIELNGTYVPFGKDGAASSQRQAAQDVNAAKDTMSDAAVQRGVSKASTAYSNSSWDLVDAYKDGKIDLDKVEENSLPDDMKKMNADERRKYIKDQSSKRAEIQQKINQLNTERESFIAAKQREQADGPQTLDSAVVQVVREQLKDNHFDVPGK
jgi:hypothetical protein